jgi:UDPglucose 6-dehydrogenase
MEELYYPFVRQQGIILRGSPADAELAKLFANTALATRVAMFDEFARIADATPGADMETIRRMVCSDARIGFMFSYPGAGYGGSCFPKDVQGVCAQACHDGFCPGVLGAVHKSNEDHKQYVAEKIVRLLSPGEKRVVSVWGVTFKPQTDDMRDAPSRVVVPYLVDSGIDMNVFEPKSEKARTVFGENPHIRFFEDQYSAVAGADALVLLTEWSQFDSPDFGKLKGIMRGRQLFDMRNRWQPSVANRHGFDYFGMGRNYPLKKGS